MAGSSTLHAGPPPVARGGKDVGHLASAWLPVLVCILVIATESTIYFGADRTTGPLQHLVEYLLGRHFTQPEWWKLHLMIRKCGHFTGYGILSSAWFRAIWMTFRLSDNPNRRRLAAHGLAMLGTLAIATSDELHQLFLPNRNGSIYDVMTDCAGGLVVQAILWMSMRKHFRS